MSATCLTCGAKSTLWLCNAHVSELRDILAGLPRWINYLAETVHGQTRLGGSGRRSRADEAPLRVNLRASDLLAAVNNSLTTWVRLTCENRSVDLPDVSSVYGCAFWLEQNVSSLASDETAGECLDEMRVHVADIEQAINRPEEERPIGPCPVTLEDVTVCATRLYADKTAIMVTCPRCKSEHNVETIESRALIAAAYLSVTRWQILDSMPDVPQQSFDRWVSQGHLRPCAHDDEGKPLYKIADVRHLRARQKPRTRKLAKA